MKGVSKDKRRELWRVRYGKEISEYYKTESEAINRRIELEKTFGKTTTSTRKNYSGILFGEWEVIGDTEENDKHGFQKVIAFNQSTGEYMKTTVNILRGSKNPGCGRGRIKSNNTSGITGIWKDKNGYWIASITRNYKKYYLGSYKKKSEAISALEKYKKENPDE